MTSSPSRGSTSPQAESGESLPAVRAGTAVPVVAVVSASWAGPSRPAPTVLRELGRRWGDAVRVLLVEEPSEDVLEQWDIDVLPTWLRFLPETAPDGEHEEEALVLPSLTGTDGEGNPVCLEGPWRLERRRRGAHPKHVIDAEFGPES